MGVTEMSNKGGTSGKARMAITSDNAGKYLIILSSYGRCPFLYILALIVRFGLRQFGANLLDFLIQEIGYGGADNNQAANQY